MWASFASGDERSPSHEPEGRLTEPSARLSARRGEPRASALAARRQRR
jgi:hypothetical protein